MELIEYALALIVTLGILVTVHELGHFILARRSGVHVVRFCIGFGRPIWSRFDRHGTEFAIAALPLGGYVRMLDERDPTAGVRDPDAPIDPDLVSHQSLSVGWRIAIALGGPAANFLLAFIVFCIVALIGSTTYAPTVAGAPDESPLSRAGMTEPLEIVGVDGEQTRSWQQVNLGLADRLGETGAIEFLVRAPGATSTRPLSVPITDWHAGQSDPDLFGSLGLEPALLAFVGEVVPDSPAARGGLEAGDFVLAANGEPATRWDDWVDIVRAAPGEPLSLDVRRNNRRVALTVTPASETDAEGTTYGFVGVRPATHTVSYGLLGALGQGLSETAANTAMTLGLVRKMLFGQVSVKNLGGPITIAKVAGDSARSGWRYYVGILALLSISLGVLNLLPIPMLDGGHIVYFLLEWVTGRPVSERAQMIGMQVGLFLVAGLMLLVFYNDITRFL